jgi:hypothetical protein
VAQVKTSSNPTKTVWELAKGDSLVVDCEVKLEKVVIRYPAGGDAFVLAEGAKGFCKYLDLVTKMADGIKVQNSGPRFARDFEVRGGRLVAEGRNPPDVHQDGIQVMGGHRLSFFNLDIVGFAVQGIFVNTAGGGASTPTDILFSGCRVARSGATGVNINQYAGKLTLTGNEVWESLNWGRAIIPASLAPGNIIRAKDYPWKFREDAGPTPEPPKPEPIPPTDPCKAVKAELAEAQKQLAAAESKLAQIHTLSA